MLLTTAISTAAEGSLGGDTSVLSGSSDDTLADGVYSIPLAQYNSAPATTENLYSKITLNYRGLLTVEDGKYKLTVKLDSTSVINTFNITKQYDDETLNSIRFGTNCISDDMPFYSDFVDNGLIDEHWNDYFYTDSEITVEDADISMDTKYYTFEIDNLDQMFVFLAYFKENTNRKAEYQYYYQRDYIKLDTDKIVSVSELKNKVSENDISFEWSKACSMGASSTSRTTQAEIYSLILNSNVSAQQTESGISASFSLNDVEEANQIVRFSVPVFRDMSMTDSGKTNAKLFAKQWNTTYNDLDISENSFSINFENDRELVFGQDIRFDTSATISSSSCYYGTIHLALNSATDVVKTDEATGFTIASNSDNTLENTVLNVAVNDESIVDSAIISDCENSSFDSRYYIYSLSLMRDGENYYPTNNITYKIPIPENWNIDNLYVEAYNSIGEVGHQKDYNLFDKNSDYAKEHPGVSVYTIEDGYFITTLEIKYVNGTFVIRESFNAINPATLEDGVYDVTASLMHATSPGKTSMANAGIDHSAILVKNGEVIDIYLEFTPIIMSLTGNTELWIGGLYCLTPDDATVFCYICNDDGSLLDNTIYDAITEFPCLKSMKITLNADRLQEDNTYMMGIYSPVMASLNDLPFEEIPPLNCKLALSSPELIGDVGSVELPSYQKSALRREIDLAKTYEENVYTAESFSALQTVISTAQGVYDSDPSSAQIEEQIEFINAAISSLVPVESAVGDKAELSALVVSAKTKASLDYTEASFAALQTAIANAEAVLNIENAAQTELDTQVTRLQTAISGLVDKPSAEEENDLPDGKYELYAEMVKIDRASYSMANNGINHTVLLEVINGEYYLTVQFKGVAIYNKFGYLMDLYYYDAGYAYDSYGNPQGGLTRAQVLSYYDVVDQYNDSGNLYPQLLRIKVVDKGDADYIPLQVFVPVMEAISAGTGTQDVLMKINWSTLMPTTGDIVIEEEDEQSPAVSKTDSSTGIKIYAEAGVLPSGTAAKIKKLTSGDDYSKAKIALEGVGNNFALYDITLLNGSTEIQPNGLVKISLPIPSGYDSSKLALYRINTGGTKTLISGSVSNGYYVFYVNHFSLYAIVEKGSALAEDDSLASSDLDGDGIMNIDDIENPTTGSAYPSVLLGAVIIALLALGGCLTVSKKKKSV
jgi:hypothetical protein